MNVQEKKNGFTIIEVVLVLAIAGLIFLMVFIALPALQRSQRDSARKSEVATVISAITNYQSNNSRGQVPTGANIAQYVTGNTDANSAQLESGTTIIVRDTQYSANRTITAKLTSGDNTGADELGPDQIKVYFGSKCTDESNKLTKGTAKQVAVVVALEAGPAGGSVYCQSS